MELPTFGVPNISDVHGYEAATCYSYNTTSTTTSQQNYTTTQHHLTTPHTPMIRQSTFPPRNIPNIQVSLSFDNESNLDAVLNELQETTSSESINNLGTSNFNSNREITTSLPDLRSLSPTNSEGSNLSASSSPDEDYHYQRTQSWSSSDSHKHKPRNTTSRPKRYKFNPKPLTLDVKLKRTPAPAHIKDTEYWEKRRKNNEASKRSRLARKEKEQQIINEVQKLQKENDELKEAIKLLQLQKKEGLV